MPAWHEWLFRAAEESRASGSELVSSCRPLCDMGRRAPPKNHASNAPIVDNSNLWNSRATKRVLSRPVTRTGTASWENAHATQRGGRAGSMRGLSGLNAGPDEPLGVRPTASPTDLPICLRSAYGTPQADRKQIGSSQSGRQIAHRQVSKPRDRSICARGWTAGAGCPAGCGRRGRDAGGMWAGQGELDAGRGRTTGGWAGAYRPTGGWAGPGVDLPGPTLRFTDRRAGPSSRVW